LVCRLFGKNTFVHVLSGLENLVSTLVEGLMVDVRFFASFRVEILHLMTSGRYIDRWLAIDTCIRLKVHVDVRKVVAETVHVVTVPSFMLAGFQSHVCNRNHITRTFLPAEHVHNPSAPPRACDGKHTGKLPSLPRRGQTLAVYRKSRCPGVLLTSLQ